MISISFKKFCDDVFVTSKVNTFVVLSFLTLVAKIKSYATMYIFPCLCALTICFSETQLPGDLQRPQEVFEGRVRGGLVWFGQHGNLRRELHAERYPWRGGQCCCNIYKIWKLMFEFVLNEGYTLNTKKERVISVISERNSVFQLGFELGMAHKNIRAPN